MINLSNLDLNLLRTLDVLLTEHHVTRAAERLHLSQPSVSVHLSKLRELFNDPLLIPDSRGMKPTALADELRQPLRQALESLEKALLTTVPFEPALSQQTWRLSASDYSEFTIIQPAMNVLFQEAPQSRIAVTQMIPGRLARQMERGEIDLAFHIRENAPQELRSKALFSERYVLVGRAGHPVLRQPVSVGSFCQLKHVVVSPDGGGFVGMTDEVLKEKGLARDVVLSVPHFHFVISVLKTSDLVAMLPHRLVQDQTGLVLAEPPIELPPFELVMLWHERSHRDPAHQWLRAKIAGVCG
ncbi:LysR family transcriptional regulator [Vibrio quintilis]|uniref:HTH-type transcriptional regulator SyrM 1 n=1 Tax=Vibrio quintilis TaxID=1117707 RepID=A0A1M7YUK2_9VIBR|nr:LysR family transcriptional regulator [Vibrio quintilis]SHO56248.1 HTH-type transcriptional regulator SyrM 1 [Vibrio quintilis]